MKMNIEKAQFPIPFKHHHKTWIFGICAIYFNVKKIGTIFFFLKAFFDWMVQIKRI